MIVSCDKSRYRVTPDYISPVLVSFSQQREVSRQSDTVTPPDLLGPREQSVSVPHKQETAPGPWSRTAPVRCLYKATVTNSQSCHLSGPSVNIVTASPSTPKIGSVITAVSLSLSLFENNLNIFSERKLLLLSALASMYHKFFKTMHSIFQSSKHWRKHK